ncbi:hypothetical protein [Sulfurimonas paralvinellae]|uniref:Thioredoxin family protein n=1 Tax=Sulfurimonas paralvinellae TaxID=317658 RepID=A0A7M1B992_9BACT|nr:hypothetical protein [Sulfurimonas paralvinellae]QOP45388.1 hypothetical protein FM071_03485 [Sulfurimonas paralvinellae]
MIKGIVVLILLALYADAFIIESSYEMAHTKALKKGKSLVVFLTKKNCNGCNEELAKIIHSKDLSLSIDEYAVFVIGQQGQKGSYPIEMLYTTQYPALFILDENELLKCNFFSTNMEFKDITKCIKP